jgi:glycosyltransferase involved in cell wall biosynthesis
MEWAFANRPRLVPHLHIEDGFGPEETDGQLRRRVLARRFALAHSVVVVPSLTLRRLALEKWRLSPDRIRYIPNGIDCGRFAKRCDPIAVPEGQGPVIGTVAVLRPEKNIERLLDAIRIVRSRIDCRLLIAGDGPERSRLERIARDTLPEGSVIFAGHMTDVERVYAALDVFALSSETEQMPTSVMEAMASGLAIAATSVGDIPEMVSPGNRPFIVDRDAQALGESIYRLAVDEVSRRRLGEENGQIAKNRFDAARMFHEYGMMFLGG